MELELRAMSQSFIDVYVLADESDWTAGKLNLVAKNIVIVSGGQYIFPSPQLLVNAGVKRAALSRLQIRIRNRERPVSKSLFQTRLFNPSSIGSAQTRS